MTYRDLLSIFLRLLGVYFLWQCFQAIFFAVFVGALIPQQTQTSGLLDMFSGSSMSYPFVFQSMIVSILTQGIAGFLLVTQPKKLVKLFTKDLPDNKSPLLSGSKNESIGLVIQIIGLIYFVNNQIFNGRISSYPLSIDL
ncbi:MAG: hypothetical protein ACOZAN_04860 [Patescibacteria group bacterium]